MSFFARPQSRSAAVKIVAPPQTTADPPQDESVSPSKGQVAKKDSTQRQCKNILIHGHCKFEGKGCVYYHPPKEDPTRASNSSDYGVQFETPVTPTTAPAAIPAQAVNAPVFVPRAGSVASARADGPQSRITSPAPTADGVGADHDAYDFQSYYHSDVGGDIDALGMNGLSDQVDQMNFTEYAMQPADQVMVQQGYNGVAPLDTFFPSQDAYVQQPLNYHLYSAPMPVERGKKFFISDKIREELTKRSETSHSAPMHGVLLPEEMQGYHSLVPIDSMGVHSFSSWNTMLYRATKADDGVQYCLRRIENFRLMQEAAFTPIEAWSRIRHPTIVYVREAFTTRAFGDNSLVVVHDYHPDSQSLYDIYLKPKASYHGARVQHIHERISETTLWSYIFQLASAIKLVHEAGMAIRMMDPSRILVTSQNRVRISSCGVADVLAYEARPDLLYMQQEDVVMFAKLVMSLATNNPSAVQYVHKSMEIVGRHYSSDLVQVIHTLMKPMAPQKTIQGLFETFGSKLVLEMDASLSAVDKLEGDLQSELENGRLVRLLCKFGFINERPEFDRDPRWSETGDRYIIKLFRDYVFHSVDESGNPVVNLSHVLTNLNKLDAGTDERIMLVSRDEQSCLVVSYREIKICIETAFADLSRGSR